LSEALRLLGINSVTHGVPIHCVREVKPTPFSRETENCLSGRSPQPHPPRREITARGRHVEIDVHAPRLQSRRAAALRRRERGAAVRKLVRSSLGSVVERSSDRLCQVRLVHKLLRLQPMPAAVPEPPALPAAPAAAASTAVACRGPGACRQRGARSRRLHQAESTKRRQDIPHWWQYLRDCRLLRRASDRLDEHGADVDGPLLGGRAD